MKLAGVLSGRLLIGLAAVIGPLKQNLGRAALSVAGIALGVALGVAVHLVNQAAVNEYALAVQNLSGEADLVIRGPRSGFAEDLYPQISRLPQVQYASPALEVEATLIGRGESLKIMGLDPFRAAQVQPALMGEVSKQTLDLLASDAILLSPAAAEWLELKPGDVLRVQVGLEAVALKIIGLLPAGSYSQRVGVMDIATAQWRLQRLGSLSRIDIRVKPGTGVEQFRAQLQAKLPAGAQVTTKEAEGNRSASLSRPYRVNLNVLALVALFTGAFLIFSTQALEVLRRRSQLALLQALGLTRRELVWLLIAEGALIGALGAALGVALGYYLATATLERLGGDLGGGYFPGLAPTLHADAVALAAFFVLGIGAALLGTLAPALEAAKAKPAAALKSGDEERALGKLKSVWPGLLLMILGCALTQAPPIAGLPLFGYSAIALILIGAILIMPRLVAVVLSLVNPARPVPAQLAAAQLKGAPGQTAVALAAIMVSFSLMVSMIIMVASFRQSLDDWLARVVPADLYLRTTYAGESGYLTLQDQAKIAATPGVARVDFVRSRNILLKAERPPVALIARSVPASGKNLPLVGAAFTPQPEAPPPVWVSEVASDVYGFQPGQRIELPIEGKMQPFTVAGIWRDYARQQGAIVMDRDFYIQLTGDRAANDAQLWLEPGHSAKSVAEALRDRMQTADGFELYEPGEVRAISLSIFDRSFAVTYALEAVAVLIGLFGISVGFSARVLARRGEFGMLRHFGMSRGQIGAMLGAEGAMVSVLGVFAGLAVGWVISLILIYVVNRQSFHWSMELHMPWLPLVALATILIVAATLTAVWSGRQAMSADVIRAVKEDW